MHTPACTQSLAASVTLFDYDAQLVHRCAFLPDSICIYKQTHVEARFVRDSRFHELTQQRNLVRSGLGFRDLISAQGSSRQATESLTSQRNTQNIMIDAYYSIES